MSRRQPIGRVVLTSAQSRDANAGKTIDIPAAQFREHVKAKAHIGDLIWAQEDWILMEHKKRGGRYVRVGPMARWRNDLPRGVSASDCRLVRDKSGPVAFGDPRYLRRTDSCLTLEIIGHTDTAVTCMVHLAQVDKFIEARAASK